MARRISAAKELVGEAKSTMTLEEAKDEIRDLWAALEESVKLQSHYAFLLNCHDGGQRKPFDDAQAWVDRLIDIGRLPVGQHSSLKKRGR
jgi:flavodoxin